MLILRSIFLKHRIMKKLSILAVSLAVAVPLIIWAKNDNKTRVNQNLTTFNAIYKELHTSYVDSLDSDKAIRNAIDAMLGQIDPYTEYYPAEEQDALRQLSSGEYSGIGSAIMQRDGHVVLSDPQWGSPALQAGVKHGDVIVAIDGDTLPNGYTSAEASKRLRGQAGTPVKVTVKRPYTTDSIIDIEITRGTIRTNAVPYAGMIGDSIGYIRLVTFSERSAGDVKNALQDLKKNPKMKGLILDLRDNGGGLLESAVQIVSYFVPKGTTVVTTKSRDAEKEKTYKTTQSPIEPTLPLAVLVNGNTASASEIVSGSLQDLDRAIIVGERSYGKGLVQSSRPLPYDGLLKLTIARYYIPSGRLIQAIDYSHRNPDGSVARIPDSLTTVFHTIAGREVRDGGGITPDVPVKQKEINRLIYNAVSDFWIFDFANRFAAQHGKDMPAATEFEITDSIFNDFKNFIDPEKFHYDRMCESGIKYLREAAESEGYMNDSVSAVFTQLEGLLKHDLNHDLDFNRQRLEIMLDDEISSRCYSEAEQVMRAIRNDEDVDAAIEALTQPGKYKSLLSPAPADTKK